MPKTTFLALGAACGALLLIPAAAGAQAAATAPAPTAASGGTMFSDPNAPTVFPDGSTLTAPAGQLVGDLVAVSGTVAGTRPGDTVVVQRADVLAGWLTMATTVVGADGTYATSFKADRAVKTTLRAVAASNAASAASRSAAASAAPGQAPVEGRALTLYRPAQATWYGPGFYGRKTACGLRLKKATLGVANKSLPCGTMVDLYNDQTGATISVPVIDRGPFRKGTAYDLTAATAQAIGMTDTQTIGAVRSVPVTPTATTTAATRRR